MTEPAFLAAPAFTSLDRRFAALLARIDGGASQLLPLAAALVSYQLRRGHILLDLSVPPDWEDLDEQPLPAWPSLAEWQNDLGRSPVVGAPGDTRPLILTRLGKLYLQRYWAYENLLSRKFLELTEGGAAAVSAETDARLAELFGDAVEQRAAARNALARRLSVISGGPGTGKTTTVLKILILLLEKNPERLVRLAAPTGKAAARMRESLRQGLEKISVPSHLAERLEAIEASTVHRLLGAIPGSVHFRHHAESPLAADVVVVDEASMVDLPLMAKLVDALPPHARLLLLGDKDQLASVEAGGVLAGLIDAATEETAAPVAGVATILRRNYRFGNESGIFRICNAIREGAVDETIEILQRGGDDVRWRALPEPRALKESLRARIVEGWKAFLKERDPGRSLDRFGAFQILTALRRGVYGKENLNAWIEEILREEGMIPAGRNHYPGRPVLVTENDYSARLFNGDIGVLLDDDDEEGKLMAFFRNEDGSVRKVSPLRLPSVEPAFAMTVHKAQGSEFEEVIIILPSRDAKILTRELLYTAISRARKRVEIWGSEDVIGTAVSCRVQRASGLIDLLRDERRMETGV